jgi:hypothetical protein
LLAEGVHAHCAEVVEVLWLLVEFHCFEQPDMENIMNVGLFW